jgi:UDP-N-acetylmuramate: L-alanyl-gamma-D-glutamyl-meso-diaminopimelate ligase
LIRNNFLVLKRVHFIAIGGAAMHNLAIALKNKGYEITGSDDEIFEPSRSRLTQNGLLPEQPGWHPEKLNDQNTTVILGMHARPDNPELLKARELGLKIFSYPEFLYEQTRNKKRVVIAGSHGKTTITAMVIHVMTFNKRKIDFMVGSHIEGFENMVALSDEAEIAIFEGDEYLSSPLDSSPKFMHYKPDIALISGIAWDHINVFPTFEEYVLQFTNLIRSIREDGKLVYYEGDEILREISNFAGKSIDILSYGEHPFKQDQGKWCLLAGKKEIPVNLFGRHNLQNIEGARTVCKALGISDNEFYNAITVFPGTKKRLQVLHQTGNFICYLDFAHSPSKVVATLQAVKENYAEKKIVAVLELHSFSSLNREFIPHYNKTLGLADEAVVYYDLEVLKHKHLEDFTDTFLLEAFQYPGLRIINQKMELSGYIASLSRHNTVLLLMSSGNFGGLNIKNIVQ